MSNIDIIITESGLLEKFGCSVEDIKQSYELWDAGRCFPLNDGKPDDIFFTMMNRMAGDLKSVDSLLEHQIKKTRDFMLECEVKKALGTYEDFLVEIESQMPIEQVEQFFAAFDKMQPANSNLPKFS